MAEAALARQLEALLRALSYRAKAAAMLEMLDHALAAGELTREAHLRESRGLQRHRKRAETQVTKLKAQVRAEAERAGTRLQKQLSEPEVTMRTDLVSLQSVLRQANLLLRAERPEDIGARIDLPLDAYAREFGEPQYGGLITPMSQLERGIIAAVTLAACTVLLGVVIWKLGPQPVFSIQSFGDSAAPTGIRATNSSPNAMSLYLAWDDETRRALPGNAYGIELWASTEAQPQPRKLPLAPEAWTIAEGGTLTDGRLEVLPGFFAEVALAPGRAAIPVDAIALEMRVTDRFGRSVWSKPLPYRAPAGPPPVPVDITGQEAAAI